MANHFIRIILTIAAGTAAISSIPANAQKVYTMPSLSDMMNGVTPAQRQARQNDPEYQAQIEKARNDRIEQRQKIEDAIYREKQEEKARQDREARESFEEAQKLEKKRHKELMKLIKKMNKPKKYKPLKRVKTLPPNSTAY